MPPNNNMIPVLEDLREADIRFFFKYDFDHKVMFFYYDPTRTKDAEKLLSKYWFIDERNQWAKDDDSRFSVNKDKIFKDYRTAIAHDEGPERVYKYSDYEFI